MTAGQNATVPATSRPGSTVRRTRAVQRRLAATDVGRRNLALEMMALDPDRPACASMGRTALSRLKRRTSCKRIIRTYQVNESSEARTTHLNIVLCFRSCRLHQAVQLAGPDPC
jgi:hypothetical protein